VRCAKFDLRLKADSRREVFCVPTVKRHASTILGAFEQARTELIGKAVILTDGKAGTVENVWLDEFHGLRISIKCHEGRWPVSTIKFAQS
jgi:hypothetical protein